MPSLKRIFGANLRRIRLRKGLSQEELAERLNLTSHSISNIERGVHGPRFATLERLVEVLDTSAEELFCSRFRPLRPRAAENARD